jgi:hypothetical protein
MIVSRLVAQPFSNPEVKIRLRNVSDLTSWHTFAVHNDISVCESLKVVPVNCGTVPQIEIAMVGEITQGRRITDRLNIHGQNLIGEYFISGSHRQITRIPHMTIGQSILQGYMR